MPPHYAVHCKVNLHNSLWSLNWTSRHKLRTLTWRLVSSDFFFGVLTPLLSRPCRGLRRWPRQHFQRRFRERLRLERPNAVPSNSLLSIPSSRFSLSFVAPWWEECMWLAIQVFFCLTFLLCNWWTAQRTLTFSVSENTTDYTPVAHCASLSSFSRKEHAWCGWLFAQQCSSCGLRVRLVVVGTCPRRLHDAFFANIFKTDRRHSRVAPGRTFRRKTQDQPGVGQSHHWEGCQAFPHSNMNSTHGFGSSAERASRADEQSCVSFSRRKR